MMPFTPVLLDQSYVNLKNQVIKAERRVLKELGFCVHGKHPHKLVICYMQTLGLHTNSEMVQKSWNYMNDVLRTDAFVRHFPETIACACIFLAARDLQVPLPKQPSWMDMFFVDEANVKEIALSILRLYVRPPPDIEKVEQTLSGLRKRQAELREKELELKRAAAAVSQNAASSALETSPKSPSQLLPLISPDIDKIKLEKNEVTRGTDKEPSRATKHRRNERRRRDSSSDRSHTSDTRSSSSKEHRKDTRRRRSSPGRKKKRHHYSSSRRKRSPSYKKEERYSRNRSRSPNKAGNGYDLPQKEDLRDKLSAAKLSYRHNKHVR
ncbi:Cyclin-L1 [Cichlidogyrus casuarinus]|uniref:Cyclin-L1 n=1 Tax=Cichlidogyrus casuarinus TaxID=1844966 RepID=A0ABD2QMG1_9PLAT